MSWGFFVQSFNHMAKDLQEGRMSLTHANAMLAEHNRYIETVLDNITTGVITLDADGRIRTMNKAASSIFDAQPERLEGRNPAEFLPRSYSNIFVSMLETLREHPEQNWEAPGRFSAWGSELEAHIARGCALRAWRHPGICHCC